MPEPACPGCGAVSPYGALCRRCSGEFHADGPMVRDLTGLEAASRQRHIDQVAKVCPSIARRMTPFGDGSGKGKGKRGR